MPDLNLFPEDYETEVMNPDDLMYDNNQAIGYRNGILFDYEKGDFVRDGQNRMVDSDGIDSWKSWCINCLQTQRYMHLAYNSDFGIDLTGVFEATTRAEAESMLTREITEAILADPYGRTAYIDGLNFTWTAPDSVQIDITIQGITDVTIDLTAYITKGEV